MRIAVVDCGTNTFNLLIADADANGWVPVFQNKLPVKLGAGGFDTKEILPSRFVRGIDALFCHYQNVLNYACDKVVAVATSALREASNGQAFLQVAHKVASMEIHLISGDEEAELIHHGITQTLPLGDEHCLMMDIGGGSTEFIIANASGIVWKKSYLLGVSRLRDQVNASDRLTQEELQRLDGILRYALSDLQEQIKKYDCQWLVGSSGSFDTILALYRQHAGMKDVAVEAANDIDLSVFPTVHRWLLKSSYEERLVNPVIPLIRAEFMPLASSLIQFVLKMHPFTRLVHSSYSLKEGLMQKIVREEKWEEHEPTNSSTVNQKSERPDN